MNGKIVEGQEEILKLLQELKQVSSTSKATVPYITAMEFMEAVRIKRTKSDQPVPYIPGIIIVFVIRALAIRFNWPLPKFYENR